MSHPFRSVLLCAALWLALALTAQGAIAHRFLAVDNGGNRLVLVDQLDPAKGWSVAIPGGSRDLQALEGTVLASHGDGAAEYDLASGERRWSVTGFKGVSSARRLPNGNTVLTSAEKGVALIEVDRDGKAVTTTAVPGASDPRLLRRLDAGGWLLALASPKKLLEVDGAGQARGEFPLPGKGYVAHRLADGRLLATTGEAVSVVELGADGKPLAEYGGKQQHGAARLLWFSGFDVLANGNMVVANWCGHGEEGKGPHAVEFDRANKLVWQWEDHKAAKTVTNILVLQ